MLYDHTMVTPWGKDWSCHYGSQPSISLPEKNAKLITDSERFSSLVSQSCIIVYWRHLLYTDRNVAYGHIKHHGHAIEQGLVTPLRFHSTPKTLWELRYHKIPRTIGYFFHHAKFKTFNAWKGSLPITSSSSQINQNSRLFFLVRRVQSASPPCKV